MAGLQTTLSDDLARVIRVRDMMQKEVDAFLQLDYPMHTPVLVDYERAGQVYTISGTVIGHHAGQGAAELIVRNNATGKRRVFDVRCYRVRKAFSGGRCSDNYERVTPQPAPHKRPPTP